SSGLASSDGKKAPVHLLSAVVHKEGIVIAQKHVDEKTNEITRVPCIMTSIRNLVMGIFRLLGFHYIHDAIRYFAMRLQQVFLLLGDITNHYPAAPSLY
ncbi:MAG: hypothetical protein AB1798_00135, partial [Spirochaetota bacterium]